MGMVTNQDVFNAQAGASAQALRDNQAVRVTEQATTMVAGALSHVEAYEQSLRGSGAEALASWQKVRGITTALERLRSGAPDAIDAIRADTRLPKEHRDAESSTMRRNAEIAIQKLAAELPNAVAEHVRIRDRALLPKPPPDPIKRSLIRQDILLALGGKVDFESARDYLASASPQHAGEFLHELGPKLFQGQGKTESFAGLTRYAMESIVAGSGGVDHQQAARRAVQEFRGRKIEGQLGAFVTAATMQLKRREG